MISTEKLGKFLVRLDFIVISLEAVFSFYTIKGIWFNTKIKSLIHEKNITFERLRSDRRRNSCLRRQVNCLQDRLNDSIEASKQKYYCRMTNKLTNAKKVQKLTGQY